MEATQQTVAQQATALLEANPQGALDLVLAETERVQAEVRASNDVTFGPEGVAVKTLNGLWRLAQIYATSQMVPDHFRGNVPDCAIAIQMALRCHIEPVMLLQNCYIVHGKPGIEAKLAIAMCNAAKVFSGRISWRLEGEGEGRTCCAFAADADTGEVCEQTVTFAMAKAEGWVSKAGSKWKTMPDLMLQYRSAMFLIRLYCPEVLMGMQSREELDDDIAPRDVLTDAAPVQSLDDLTDRLTGAPPEAEPKSETLAETTTKPNKSEPPKADEQQIKQAEVLDPLEERLTGVKSLIEVTSIEDEFLSEQWAPTKAEILKIKAICETARMGIKAGRGGKDS